MIIDINKMSDEQVYSYLGFKRQTIEKIKEIVIHARRVQHLKRGRKNTLTAISQVILTLEKLRNNLTNGYLGIQYKIDESTINISLLDVLKTLYEHSEIVLPGIESLMNDKK